MISIPLISFIINRESQKEKEEVNNKINSNSKITVLNHKTNKLFKIEIKEYIKGVVLSEIPANFHEEAIKAQAIVANTYLLRQIESQKNSKDQTLKGAHISTDPNKHQGYMSNSDAKNFYKDKYEEYENKVSNYVYQVIDKVIIYNNQPIIAAYHSMSNGTDAKNFYKDKYEEYENKVSNYVYQVIDKVIIYNNQPIIAAYHSMSNGKTESAKNIWGSDVPYLQPVNSEVDILNQNYENTIYISAEEVEQKLKDNNKDLVLPDDKSTWFESITRSDSNNVLEILIGNINFSGTQIRNIFKLKSNTFDIKYSENNFIFTTKGYGHGVGMSQYGANSLAYQGKSYNDIINHYYKNTEIKSIFS